LTAGNGTAGFGGDGGLASEASLSWPGSVAVDAKGNVYIADWQNERIRKINPPDVRLIGSSNGVVWEIPRWHTTQADGSHIESCTFTIEAEATKLCVLKSAARFQIPFPSPSPIVSRE
jgi:NHL repeat-containing protein